MSQPAIALPPVLPRESERLRALHSYQILDTPPEAAFDELVALAGRLLGMPMALVTLVDSQRQWFKAKIGLDLPETARDEAFCAHAIASPELMVIEDALLDDRFCDNPLVLGDPNIRFYAGAPLMTADGHGLGTLCVLDRVPRQLTDDQRALLQVLSRQVMTQLDLRRMLDLSRRQHADLLHVLNAVPAALIVADSQGDIEFQNDAARDLVGQHGGDPADVRRFWHHTTVKSRSGEPLPPASWPAMRAMSGDTVVGEEFLLELPDGRRLPILLGAAPLRDAQHCVTGAVVGFQDVSALYEVARLKSEFVSTVSHELRTPMTSIRGSLQLVLADEETHLGEDSRALVTVALNNTGRLIRIINDILDVAKIEAGQMALSLSTTQAAALVHSAVDAVRGMATEKGLTITTDVATSLPAIRVDQDRVVQSLVNLLSNAVKFSATGTVVCISATGTADGGVCMTVSDQGEGIPPEELARVFEKFHQVGGSHRQGTGLGLSITKGLIEEHGGTIAVTSEVGTGTTFTIILSAAPQDRTNTAHR